MPQEETQTGTKEVFPYRGFSQNGVTKDFTVKPVPSDTPDPDMPKDEEEEGFEVVPKDESARGSAPSSESTPTTVQDELETIVPAPASRESGKPSKSTAEAPASQRDENSSQPSSSPTSPGWSTPPAPVVPPTNV